MSRTVHLVFVTCSSGKTRVSLQFILSDESLYTEAYLTMATTCSQGASIELLLSSAASLLYMLGLSQHQISAACWALVSQQS